HHGQSAGGRQFEDRAGRGSVEVAVVGEEKSCLRPGRGDLSEGKNCREHAVGSDLENCASIRGTAVGGAAVELFIGANRQFSHGGVAVCAAREINQRGENSVGGNLVELAQIDEVVPGQDPVKIPIRTESQWSYGDVAVRELK